MRIWTWDGIALLWYDPEGKRDDGRVAEGAMGLFFNHNYDNYLGRVTGENIDGDQLMVNSLRSDRSYAREIFDDVDDGIINGISPGIAHYAVEKTVSSDDEPDEWTVRDWATVEYSVTPIPANIKAGSNYTEGQQYCQYSVKSVDGDGEMLGVWRYTDDLKQLIKNYTEPAAQGGDSMTTQQIIDQATQDELIEIGQTYGAEPEALQAMRDGLSPNEFRDQLMQARMLSETQKDNIVSQTLPNDMKHTRDLRQEQGSRTWEFERAFEFATAQAEGSTAEAGKAEQHARLEVERSHEIAKRTSAALGHTPGVGAGIWMDYDDMVHNPAHVGNQYVEGSVEAPSIIDQGMQRYVVGTGDADEGVATVVRTPWERYVQSRSPMLSRTTRLTGLVGKIPVPTIGDITWGVGSDEANLTGAADAAVGGDMFSPWQDSAQSEISMLSDHQTRGQHSRMLRMAFAESLAARQEQTVVVGTPQQGGVDVAPRGIQNRLIDATAQRIPNFAVAGLNATHIRRLRELADVQRFDEADNPTYLIGREPWYALLDEPLLSGGSDVPLVSGASPFDMRIDRGYVAIKSQHMTAKHVAYVPARKVYYGTWGGVFFTMARKQGSAILLAEMFIWHNVLTNEGEKMTWFRLS